MRHSAGFLTIACALGARAILIPAGITTSSDIDNKAVLSSPPLNPKSQAIQVPCSSCAFQPKDGSENNDGLFSIQGQENSLVLEFTVSEDGERLQLNNETIYPLHLFDAEAIPHLHVPQIPWSASVEAYWSQQIQAVPLEITGSVVMVDEPRAASEDGDLVIPLTFGIVELEHQPIVVDSIAVRILKTGDGELLILGLTNIPNLRHRPSIQSSGHLLIDLPEPHHVLTGAPIPAPEHIGSQECNALCQFKAMVGSKIKALKGGKSPNCGGAMTKLQKGQLPTHIRPHFLRPFPEGVAGEHSGRPHHSQPHGSHYHHGHQHHGHHHRHHHFLSAFTRGFISILIPTLAGVAVGMAVSVVGLAVGHLVTFMWVKFVRGGRRGYASVCQEEGDAEKDLGADGGDEPPPVYEEAPAYDEAIAQSK